MYRCDRGRPAATRIIRTYIHSVVSCCNNVKALNLENPKPRFLELAYCTVSGSFSLAGFNLFRIRKGLQLQSLFGFRKTSVVTTLCTFKYSVVKISIHLYWLSITEVGVWRRTCRGAIRENANFAQVLVGRGNNVEWVEVWSLLRKRRLANGTIVSLLNPDFYVFGDFTNSPLWLRY